MKADKKIRPLSETTAELERKYYIENLKQNYGLKKVLSEIKHSIDDINKKID